MRPIGKFIYLDAPGTYVGAEKNRIYIKEKNDKIAYFNLHNLDGIFINNRSSFSTAALELLGDYHVPLVMFDWKGQYIGRFESSSPKNIFVRKSQVLAGNSSDSILRISKSIVERKISSMSDGCNTLDSKKHFTTLELCKTYEEVLGVEGSATKSYFHHIRDEFDKREIQFVQRKFHPATDPANSMLSLAYSLLMAEVELVVHIFGLDPAFGFLHRDYYARNSLVCDLMEPFRSSIADKFVFGSIDELRIKSGDFSLENGRCYICNEEKRRGFYKLFRTYFFGDEQRAQVIAFVREIYDMIIVEGRDRVLLITNEERAA